MGNTEIEKKYSWAGTELHQISDSKDTTNSILEQSSNPPPNLGMAIQREGRIVEVWRLCIEWRPVILEGHSLSIKVRD